MVHVTFSDWRMSERGLPSMTAMSASLPASRVPMSRDIPRVCAPFAVAQRSASWGESPPCTSIQISQ